MSCASARTAHLCPFLTLTCSQHHWVCKGCATTLRTKDANAVATANARLWGTPHSYSGRGHEDSEREPSTMHSPTHVTQLEAVDLTGRSYDTLRRLRRQGKLPNSRERSDGVVEVALSDLVGIGLLNPLAAKGDVTEVISRSRIERDLLEARQELALQRGENESLRKSMTRVESEVAYLRGLLSRVVVA